MVMAKAGDGCRAKWLSGPGEQRALGPRGIYCGGVLVVMMGVSWFVVLGMLSSTVSLVLTLRYPTVIYIQIHHLRLLEVRILVRHLVVLSCRLTVADTKWLNLARRIESGAGSLAGVSYGARARLAIPTRSW